MTLTTDTTLSLRLSSLFLETAECKRLQEKSANGTAIWKIWGPYLAERQWGTVREDYSVHGTAWEYFPFDMARSRAYRWGEDGIGGVSDDDQRLCLAVAFWNGQDSCIKERFFGLTGTQGNHGEDVKEVYYYLDNTPSHSYMKLLYKYPQRRFPYDYLREETSRRSKLDPELELIETGIFDEDRYFDIEIEYAKGAPEDILMKVTAYNRGPDAAPLEILPHLWYRNTWSFGVDPTKPVLRAAGPARVEAMHALQGTRHFALDREPELLFCENETNITRLFGAAAETRYFKDGVDDYVVHGRKDAVNPNLTGTKMAGRYHFVVPAGAKVEVRARLSPMLPVPPFAGFEEIFEQRLREADDYYAILQMQMPDEDHRRIQRQAYAGMLWTKQFYYFDVRRWLHGDPGQPPPPRERTHGRNVEWTHLYNDDIISMPDKWEYPWYAAWDLAFHCIPFATIDPDFAKKQLILVMREWYMHPNGQLPAYEWAFSDVNPPVHAWAAWRVFQIDRKLKGGAGDLRFLERAFHKLMLNFTWWVNRKDAQGRNIFQGGFLGLDNIGVFDRSRPLPTGGFINQADGTSWMAMYSLNLMRIALELAKSNSVYEDIASKFFEHFLYIAQAMTNIADTGHGLWDEDDEFFYDVLNLPDSSAVVLRLRSMVGLIPLFAVETLEPELLDQVPHFHRRLRWFLDNRPEMAALVSRWTEPGRGDRRLLSLLRGHRMKCLLKRMLDPGEFLSDFGVRALSRYHHDNPFVFQCGGEEYRVRYQPGESDSGLFGGNSNWRGPIWFPVNYLLIESLQKFHHYYGDDFKVECPTGSGKYMTIEQVAEELSARLVKLFVRNEKGDRPIYNGTEKMQRDPHFRDHLMFHEYFHGDSGRGLGAAHQTGWTGLIAKLLQPRRKDVLV